MNKRKMKNEKRKNCRVGLVADGSPGKSFRHSFLMIVLIFITMTNTACTRSSDWVQFRGEGGRGVSASRISPPLGLKWKIDLQPGSDEIIRSLNPPVVIGDTIYFGSDDGNFYALDVESGFMRWVFKSGANINSIPYADKDQVYFGSKDGKLYALSRETGEEVWSFQTRSQINSQVQRYGDYIVFVGDADAVYFLSPDGEQQFIVDNPTWYNYTFLMHDDVMYFAPGQRGHLIGPYDINQKEYLWFLSLDDFEAIWYSFSAVRGDLLYFGTADILYNGMYLGYHAFNRHTGELVWRHYIDGILNSHEWNYLWDLFWRYVDLLDFLAPTVWGDLVIFAGGDNTARAFDADTGVLRWEHIFDTPVSSAPTLADGRVYFGLMGSENTSGELIPPQLVCLSARDGKMLWQMDIEGSILSAPVIAGKRIIFGTDENIFYVLEQVF